MALFCLTEPMAGMVALTNLALAAIILLPLYLVASSIYYAFFHPLAKVPGPRLYAVSQLPYLYHIVKGDWNNSLLLRLHEQYGHAVRFAPNDVSFISVEALNSIYAHKKHSSQNFEKDLKFYTQAVKVENLINADNENHRRQRRLLSHAFSERALRNQESVMKHYSQLFINGLTERVHQGKVVNMVAWFNFATFDLIGDLAFGKPFGSLESGQYHPWVSMIFNNPKALAFTQILSRTGLVRFAMYLVPPRLKKALTEHLDFAKHTTLARIDAGDTQREDFMSYILRQNDDRSMSRQEMVDTADLLVLAGSETTATLLSGATYLILKNRDKYDKLTNEIRSAYKSEEEITMLSVNHLKYMLAVLDESFRMYPPVPLGLPRLVPRGGESVDGYWLPENTVVSVPQFASYRSARNFKDPDTFVPERWMGDARYDDDYKAILKPFSAGPRDCIGKNLAYAEMRLLLARLLWKFDLELQPESQNWSDQQVFVLWQKGEMKVRLTEVQRETEYRINRSEACFYEQLYYRVADINDV